MSAILLLFDSLFTYLEILIRSTTRYWLGNVVVVSVLPKTKWYIKYSILIFCRNLLVCVNLALDYFLSSLNVYFHLTGYVWKREKIVSKNSCASFNLFKTFILNNSLFDLNYFSWVPWYSFEGMYLFSVNIG